MFNHSNNCRLVGMSLTSKHQRLSLTLLHPETQKEFTTAFTQIAAYDLGSIHLGKVITNVSIVNSSELITNNWDKILRADMAGLWPGSEPTDAAVASKTISQLGLLGFKITLGKNIYAWAIGRDYILLGRKQPI